MYPLLRFVTSSIHASMSKPVSVDEFTETTFQCMPRDIDLFLEMNNGRILTLYDLGRFGLAIRTGLGKVLRKEKWGLVVAGNTIIYRRRVKIFDKVTMRSQVVALEDRWFYIAQSMWVKGEPASSVLLRTGITGKGKIIPTSEVVEPGKIS